MSVLAGFAASAQTAPRPPAAVPPDTQAAPPPGQLEAIRQRDQELQALREQQRKAAESEARLKREIDALAGERRKLNAQLIETAAKVREVEERIARAENRLDPLSERERTIRNSLDARRAVMSEVLAALQRIGRHPPPALVVSPEDALRSVRSAMLLGAVIPEMRQQAAALLADLAELTRLRKDITEERDRLTVDLAAIGTERKRLADFIDQRQKAQAEAEKALAAERNRAAILGRTAKDLQDLIAKLEEALEGTTRAARTTPPKAGPDGRPDLAALKDPGRLAPAIAFAAAKGILPLPVNGVRIREFGAPDGLGSVEKGLSIATRPHAQITAPCDGWVVYSGPFRNYGQLLILNAGDGYHVLLAGMERISVDLGQFVLTGEPVAVMGGGVQAVAALAIGSSQPVLYVEFRKDGTPIDPGPWWAKSEGEKVRG